MNILLLSLAGEAMTLVQPLREEGHDVVCHIWSPGAARVGDGLVWKGDDLSSLAAQADVICFCENGRGYLADQWRGKGYRVWNGGQFAEKLEYDRTFGMKTFAEAGVTIPDTYEVSSISDVKSVLAAEFRPNEQAVIKLDSSEHAGSCFSFVAESTEQLLDQVDHWVQDDLLGDNWSGIIQRFVKGIEVSVEAWWNGESWSMHNVTIEEKRLLTGDLGPNVGCAGNTIFAISPTSRLFKLVLEPLGSVLAKNGYVGQIDTNSIVDEKGVPHALEFTPRNGYDATPTLAWGHPSGYGHAIARAFGIEDRDLEQNESRGRFWCGVRVHVPPYPFDCKNEEMARKVNEQSLGVPLDVPEHLRDSFYLFDAMESDGQLVCAGTTGIVGIALGGGDDIQSAGKAAYKVAEQLKIPNKSFRAKDLFHRAASQVEELLDMKLIRLG